MKRCPSCRRIYHDDASVVCSYDDSPLLSTATNVDPLAETLETSTDVNESTVLEQLIFKRDDSSIVEIDRKSVVRRTILTITVTSIFGVCFFVWFIVGRALAEPPSNTPLIYLLAPLPIIIILGILSAILSEKNDDHRRLYSYKGATGRMGKYISKGRFAKKTEDGNYIMYKMSMPCTYPTCDGIVYISAAPSEPGDHFTGSCTSDPYTHRYEVDANGLAAKATKK